MSERNLPFQLWVVKGEGQTEGIFISGHSTQAGANRAKEECLQDDVGYFRKAGWEKGFFRILRVKE